MIEDPNQNLKQFLQLCDAFKYNGVSDDAIRLRLFPFSLIDNVFSWLDLQALGSITTWDELAGKFLQKFFPISKAKGVDANVRSGLDGAAGGALMNRTYEDGYEIIENMAFNSCQWPNERFTYGLKPVTVKAIQEDDKYQQIVDSLNRIESASTPSMHGGDKSLFH
ncbi:uncharacterized protein LOC105797621 [Gossypium raimondii]|uniref:uncharacterized protein LOC105797621 n=1 Tax=Gossypium raimondii TaxID=29730 RepID=UPI00063B03DD|nr:uncharacterized protein LOC105797621 [Gossypium raimondii]